MSFQPVNLNALGIPIVYDTIVIGIVTAALLYVPVRYATPAGFYLVKKLFARLTGTKMSGSASMVPNRKAGNPGPGPGTGSGSSGSGTGGSGIGGGGIGGVGGAGLG